MQHKQNKDNKQDKQDKQDNPANLTPGKRTKQITTKENNNINFFLISLCEKGFYVFLESSSLRVIPSGLPSELKKALIERKQEIISFLRSKQKDSILSPDVEREALWLIKQFSPDTPNHARLTSLLRKAQYYQATDNDLIKLSLAIVEIYARELNPEYRAAIWGGRTWLERCLRLN